MGKYVAQCVLMLMPLILLSQQTATDTVSPKSYTMSMDQAIAFALENNYSAINAGRDITSAEKQKWETIASGLPQIDAGVDYQNQLIQQVTLLPAEIAGGDPGTYVPVVFSQKQSMNATATLNQLLFDGSYIVGVQAAKVFMEYSQNNKEKTDLDVRKAVVEAYGNVLLAKESVTIIEKNKETVSSNLNESEKMLETGFGEEENVEQLQITMANLENDLKRAISMQDVTQQMLNLVLGIPTDVPVTLTDDLDALVSREIDLGLMEHSLQIENNIDYKLALNLNQQRELELKLEKSRYLPTLNAFVNYGQSSFNDDFVFLGSDADWYESSVLGVALNIPIFSSGMRNARTQRAEIALDQARTQMTEAQEQIRVQLKQAQTDYIYAIEQYQTSKENLRLAERIEHKNEVKYFEGLATSFDLRQAQVQLYTTQREYLTSMVEVINAKTNLETILNEN